MQLGLYSLQMGLLFGKGHVLVNTSLVLICSMLCTQFVLCLDEMKRSFYRVQFFHNLIWEFQYPRGAIGHFFDFLNR